MKFKPQPLSSCAPPIFSQSEQFIFYRIH